LDIKLQGIIEAMQLQIGKQRRSTGTSFCTWVSLISPLHYSPHEYLKTN
jgi:hypothetical protein